MMRPKINTAAALLVFVAGICACTAQEQPAPEPEPVIVVEPDDTSSVYGLVSCDGKGLAGVVVSDGVKVVRTNPKGVYQMRSLKRNGFVFVSVPSGYEVPVKGVLPQIKSPLSKSSSSPERVDFELLEAPDQTSHTMLFFGDMHLAGTRSNCRNQFRTFTSEIAQYVKDHPGGKIYAMTLGDMTWDLYWYSKSYSFSEYLSDMAPLNGLLPVFHCIGNHDHNMCTDVDGNVSGWEAVDWDTGKAFRQAVAPSNYSFNIGKIHYIVLDDIFCKNTTGGGAYDRIYDDALCPEALDWLKRDLYFVPRSTPLVLAMHSPLFDKYGKYNLDNSAELMDILKKYSSVTVVSGHSHKFWNIIDGNVREYNSGAVCAAWWDVGYYYPELNIGQDGGPGGYRILEVEGKAMTSRFKASGKSDALQFRCYDRNCIELTAKNCGITDVTAAEEFAEYISKHGGYDKPSSDNKVLINVWDKDENWKVEVSEDGKALNVRNVRYYDPLYLLAYVAKRYALGKEVSHTPAGTGNIYEVTASSPNSTLEIKVTDDEGRIYTETMKRPRQFSVSAYY